MKQNIPNSISDLLSLAGVIHIGATNYGAAIPLLHHTATVFGVDLDAATVARDNYEQEKTTVAEKMALVDSIMEAGRKQLLIGRDLLKPHIGYEYSERYTGLGLVGSASIPRDIAGVQSVLVSYKGYFEANPSSELAAVNVTAAQYESLANDLLAARGEVNTHKKTLEDLMAVRDEKADKLRKRIRWLINEMEPTVDPLSSLWTAFGLNKPGAQESPDIVEGLKAALIGPTAIALKWNQAARAQYYRVFKKVIGVDTEFVAVGSPADLDLTIEDLPNNATVEIYVTAVNDGGETQPSATISIATH